jgi:hypothetical protein
MNTQFKPETITTSIKSDDKGFFLETKAGITQEQVALAQKAGFEVITEGQKLFAVGTFDYECPTSIAGFIERDKEEKTYFKLLQADILDNHAVNRSSMLSKLTNKVPKDCESILAFMKEQLGMDTDAIPFETKCDKAALAALLKR